MTSLKNYATFIKIEHTLFSLPLLFAGALLARTEWPSWQTLTLIILAGGSARVVALVLNRIIDRHIDARNPRTKERHLANGTMSLNEAIALGSISLVIYFLSAWLISPFCLKLSWIPLLGFTAYPYFKRLTKWTHVGLGIVWALVPIAGFFAVKPSFQGVISAMILGLFSIFWLAGFDIIYATMDEEFDRQAGLHSLPAAWGSEKALRMAGLFHLLAFLVLVLFYGVWLSGPVAVLLLVVIGILLFVEFRMSNNVNLAFFHINTIIGFVVFLFVLAGLKGL